MRPWAAWTREILKSNQGYIFFESHNKENAHVEILEFRWQQHSISGEEYIDIVHQSIVCQLTHF